MRTHNKRLQRLEQTIRSLPIDADVAEEAIATFRETGELPDDVRLGYAVVKWAQTGPPQTWDDALLEQQASIRAFVERKPQPEDEVMNALYEEAIFAEGMVRAAARHALRELARAGSDPSKPLFAGMDVEVPEYGGMGLHILGMPRILAKPPYMRQAVRLFRRAAKLRDQAPHDRRWRERLDAAIHRFQHDGERPDDDLVLDMVLVCGELHTLAEHACGADVGELMAAFDAAARTTGDEREAAIGRVLDLCVAGPRELPPRDDA